MRLSPGLLSCQASDSEFLTQPWIHFAKPYCKSCPGQNRPFPQASSGLGATHPVMTSQDECRTRTPRALIPLSSLGSRGNHFCFTQTSQPLPGLSRGDSQESGPSHHQEGEAGWHQLLNPSR